MRTKYFIKLGFVKLHFLTCRIDAKKRLAEGSWGS